MTAGTIAYALCVALATGHPPVCVLLPAQECKQTLAWYLARGYTAECRIPNQPLVKGKLTK